MAIFHFHAQILGRGPGRRSQDGALKMRKDNVVAAAAYRAGERLTDKREGRAKVQDYQHRRGVAHSEIMAPENTAPWLKDREKLWNAVEKIEKRKDAQLAREIDIALPFELNDEQRIEMVRSYVATQFVSRGMVADFALHNPVSEKGDDRRNYHAHIMLTLRQATKDGLHPVKTREWNARENIQIWREAWEAHANQTLERHGHKSRVDHRTLKAQADEARVKGDRRAVAVLEREPEIHVGPRPKAMDRRKVKPESRVRETGAPRTQKTRDEYKDAKREAWQAEIEKRRESREDAYQEWLVERREQFAKDLAQKKEARRLERLLELIATDRPVRARTLTPSEAAKVQAYRKQQALARVTQQPATRRQRNYPKTDRGPRIGFLWDILTGNNMKAKKGIARIDAASARFTRWLDFWDRKATWLAEGKIGGAKFRHERVLKSEADRENKIAHAKKRAGQMRGLTDELRGIAAMLMGRQEQTLVRRRQVEGWAKEPSRDQERGREAGRGRERKN